MEMHIAEFSFPNLYLFRETHNYRVVETDHNIFISGLSYDKKRYLMPLNRPEKQKAGSFRQLKELLEENKMDFIFPIPEEWLECFPENNFTRTYNPDDSDYLFLTEKFKTYPGKSMHRKKNQLNQFLRLPDPLLIPLTPEVVEDAKSVLNTWQAHSPQDISTSDYRQCMEALEKAGTLQLTGAMAYAEGKPAGFLLGEPLNRSTFTIHFAKADIQFKGVYQFLFSRFASDFCPSCKYINLEQDLGNAGLRKTKISYRPDLMAHKYRIAPK